MTSFSAVILEHEKLGLAFFGKLYSKIARPCYVGIATHITITCHAALE